ncbi:MAG TPA: ABC transporter ATP-binding protein [Candidatus Saccharimonadales bacterium]|nr:ABC transporter ATP-binding protein [Candidatus Saccharimonadales bacterium]
MTGKRKYYSIRAYFSYIATYKWRFLFVLGFFLVADGLLAVIPIFIGHFVAALAHSPVNSRDVYRWVGLLIFCSVGHDMVWRTSEVLYLKFLLPRSFIFENIIFQSVITKPYPYFVGKFTGKLSSYVATLGREYRMFVESVFYNYVDQFVKLPTIAAIMFTVNAYTGLVFVSSLLLMLLVGRLTIRYMAQAEQKSTDVSATMDGYVIDVISNFVSVKAFKKEADEQVAVEQRRQEVIAAAGHAMIWAVVFWGALSLFVRYIIWPATILLNTWLFLHSRMSLAEITTFTSAVVIFSDYIWGTIWTASTFTLKLARIEEAYRYLFGTRNVVTAFMKHQQSAKAVEKVTFAKSLALQNLVFAYPDKKDTAVLRGINLVIKKNEKVGVVGRSGSGKTTLIKLLLGYYPVSSESVMLDGQLIDNRHLTSIISYVPQDTTLFHRSIGNNIAYGAHQAVDVVEIEKAAKQAHAHEFITLTSEGYDTLVGERGIKLSMGQRQRIAIARAFLDNKPVLILDEATSALDSESEVLVQKALENLWHDKTVIAIAHRLSTLRHMDRIVVMDEGRIVEQGTHKELLEQKGHYYRLWQHQSDGLLSEV